METEMDKMMKNIKGIRYMVLYRNESIKLEGGLLEQQLFRELLVANLGLHHRLSPPYKGKDYWTAFIYNFTEEEYDAKVRRGIKTLEVLAITLIVGVVSTVYWLSGKTWLNIW